MRWDCSTLFKRAKSKMSKWWRRLFLMHRWKKMSKWCFAKMMTQAFFGVFLATYNLLSSKKRWYELMKNTQKLAKIIRNAVVWKLTLLVWNNTFIQEKCCEFCELSKNDVSLLWTPKQKKEGVKFELKKAILPALWLFCLNIRLDYHLRSTKLYA